MYNPDALVPSTDGAPAAPDFCMKTPLSFLLAATLLAPTLTFANTVSAPIAAPAAAPASFVPPPPEIAGKAYFLNDFNSQLPIAVRDPDLRVDPASLTKLMTAYLTFKALREKRLSLEQTLLVSARKYLLLTAAKLVEASANNTSITTSMMRNCFIDNLLS